VADRALVLEAGITAQVGDPESLYHRPVSQYVARMFGPVNAIDERTADGLGVRTEAVATGGYLVRPEALRFGEAGLPGTVVARRYRGTGYMAEVALEAGTVLLVSTQSAPQVGTATKVAARVLMDTAEPAAT
jgi:ABC-type Fe3+/spermidine/putrescine transport system ATPase subunit